MPALRRRSQAADVRSNGRLGARNRNGARYRALTASAAAVDLTDRTQAQRLRALRTRSAWQFDAWEYRRRVGELRYAVAYLGNSVMRLRLYAGVFLDDDTTPVPVQHATGVIPPDLVQAAQDYIEELGNGSPTGSAQLQKKLTENFEVAGECFLVGQTDPITRLNSFNIYSVSELTTDQSGRYGIRDDPSVSLTGATNDEGVEWLDPENTFIERLWWPDPEWSKLADSPVRAVMDTLDELSLLSLDVRATARSRLANNGMLLIPEGLTVIRANSQANTDGTEIEEEVDEFLEELLETATAALTNEGSAAAAVPILMRGPAEAIAAIKHLVFSRPADNRNAAARMELIGRLATGLDLPAEVLTGKADLNHWTGWQIDDDSFRHHVEPIAQVEVDTLTAGHLWKALDAEKRWDPATIRRIVVWYDPTELVTHPDRSGDAKDAYDRGAIGRGSLRGYLGMPETDSPDLLDELLFVLTKARGVDPDILRSIVKSITDGQKIVINDAPAPTPATPAPSDTDQPSTSPDSDPTQPQSPAPQNPDDPTRGTPSQAPPLPSAASIRDRLERAKLDVKLDSIVAAISSRQDFSQRPKAAAKNRRLSKKLMDVDRRARDRLHAASLVALRRSMEHAGNRIISKSRTASAGNVRARIQGMPTWQIPMKLSRAEFIAVGVDEQDVVASNLDDMQDTYFSEMNSSTDAAASIVAELTGRSRDDVLRDTRHDLDAAHQRGWQYLQNALKQQAQELISSLDEEDLANAEEGSDLADELEAAGITLPFGIVRVAVGLAGGYGTGMGDAGIGEDGGPVDGGYVGGIGNGSIFGDVLSDSGLAVTGYEWTHGASDIPFEPHLELDGYVFTDFTDDGLAVEGDFPATGYYTPGDHNGCTCDLSVIWDNEGGGEEEPANEESDDAAA